MGTMDKVNCAIWARVSTDDQSTSNQVDALREFAASRGYQVVTTFELEESAWKGKQEAALFKAQDGARRGEYTTLVVWALDRLSRQGPEAMLRIVREFSESGCRIVSLQESWVDVPADVLPLLLSVAGWVSEQFSTRRSQQTKIGNARWLREHPGQKLGRRKGAKDVKPRKRAA
jgi:DNA invertase Pin-like site-specific DNA recombinase